MCVRMREIMKEKNEKMDELSYRLDFNSEVFFRMLQIRGFFFIFQFSSI